ncbi:nucleotide exchange factor GrpE [Alicyclobacillus mali]|uniref:Protein GrpE n=1 Tax=Alicyclobacillus mali (ex Roth et al. 2021) TaxID=1123961 RepID=A0ABS0F4R5_9BACL|nr:nucleotide exchange factor GrpE [Alicyclobacillus mali (ex Roth et al. 2021)]MBF8378248.1 nucleotide exchange factor GrpE [Alicyclobacillus mali (ex Roth et al. 2021)]
MLSVAEDVVKDPNEEEAEAKSAENAEDEARSSEVDPAEMAEEDLSYEAGKSSGDEGPSASGPDPRDTQIEELTQQLLRTRADFDNFRRRTRQEREELVQFATKKLLADLLPVLDNFDRALQALEGVDEPQMKQGIEMVHRQLTQVMHQYGVTEMEAAGAPFDPSQHEAVMQEQVEGQEPGRVIEVLQKGYLLHGKVLRPAMVKVSV